MSGLEVLSGGLQTTLQDFGRFGFRHIGITACGALDKAQMQCANALVRNPLTTAVLEMHAIGPQLRALGSVRLALAGDVDAQIKTTAGHAFTISPWQSITVQDGEELSISTIRQRVAYLAVAGGLQSRPLMGSDATYVRAEMGGDFLSFRGRGLKAGDRLLCHTDHINIPIEQYQRHGFNMHDGNRHSIRILWGPQRGHFTERSADDFVHTFYKVSTDCDRMGMRLIGTPLNHCSPEDAEIVSDGIAPGAIQVPAAGQPIILLADCQTVGGYPKIATVISADLPRLAHCVANDHIRFVPVSQEEARAALTDAHTRLQQWIAAIRDGRQAMYAPSAA